MKALVAGGGVAGLTVALALQRAGDDVTVFEKLPEIGAPPSSCVILQQNAMRVFERLGVAERIATLGPALQRLEHRTHRGALIAAWDLAGVSREAGAPTFAVHRGDLLATIEAALRPGAVRTGIGVSGFSQDAERVTAHLPGGEDERADVLIGADGVDSAVRAAMVGRRPARPAGYVLWEGVAAIPPLQPGLHQMIWGPGLRFVTYPVGERNLYWLALTRPGRVAAGAAGVKEQLRSLFRGWIEPVEAAISATDDSAIVESLDFDRIPSGPRSTGRVALIGQAAHPMTVSIPQGIAQAAEDAHVLVASLHSDPTVAEALAAYEQRRGGRPVRIAMLARGYGAAARWSDPVRRGLRNNFLRFLLNTVAIKTHRGDMAYDFEALVPKQR